MTANELRQAAKQLVAEARQLQDAADAESRDLTSEEQANFDKYMDDALAKRESAERIERLEDAERSMVESTSSEQESRGEETTDGSEAGAGGSDAERRAEQYSRAYERAVLYRPQDGPDTTEFRALQADLDIQGGYTVAPPQFVSRLIQAVDNLTFMRGLSNVIPVTSSDAIEGVSLDTDPADPAWTAEIGSVSEDSSMAFGGRALKPNQLTKLLKVSDKLMMVSALPVENIVRTRLAYKQAVTLENVYQNGTGAGQPLGVFTASAQGISTGRDVSTGNATTAFTFDGLKEAKYSLKAQYWPRLNWIFHRDGVKMAAKLKDGEGRYIWEESVVRGDPSSLLGFPVRMSEYAPSTFTTGLYVGILGDFSNYWISELQQIALKRLDELYAANGQVGFILKTWSDGMPVLEEAFARVKLA
jgi:HK97 family phage major capsid protein